MWINIINLKTSTNWDKSGFNVASSKPITLIWLLMDCNHFYIFVRVILTVFFQDKSRKYFEENTRSKNNCNARHVYWYLFN